MSPGARARARRALKRWEATSRGKSRKRKYALSIKGRAAIKRSTNRPAAKALRAKWRKAHLKQVRGYRRAYRISAKGRIALRVSDAARRANKLARAIGDPAEVVAVYLEAAQANALCQYCQQLIPVGCRHVDHIFPLARGGAHSGDNLAVTCADCNLRKRAKSFDSWFVDLFQLKRAA